LRPVSAADGACLCLPDAIACHARCIGKRGKGHASVFALTLGSRFRRRECCLDIAMQHATGIDCEILAALLSRQR
jgi:hypothetical protein